MTNPRKNRDSRKKTHIRGEDTTTMGSKLLRASAFWFGKEDIDFVVFATLSPDYYFPGPGVLVQRDLGLRTVGALDGINVQDLFMPCLLLINILKRECIKTFCNRFRSTFNGVRYDITWSWCIGNFGDGAGAAVLSREEDLTRDLVYAPTFRGTTCRRTN
jgi:3-oxoacyl-[acyl-carrier-protein] synthase-3